MGPRAKATIAIGLGAGFTLQFLAIGIFELSLGYGERLRALFAALFIGGTVMVVWSCSIFTRERGHSPAWGLLGLLGVWGLLVLAFLSDRRKAIACGFDVIVLPHPPEPSAPAGDAEPERAPLS